MWTSVSATGTARESDLKFHYPFRTHDANNAIVTPQREQAAYIVNGKVPKLMVYGSSVPVELPNRATVVVNSEGILVLSSDELKTITGSPITFKLAAVNNVSAVPDIAIVRVDIQPQTVESALEEIREIAEYEDGWDSYDAKGTTPRAIALANIAIYCSIRTSIYNHSIELHAAPIPDGGLILEWDAGRQRVQVWIHGDGSLAAAKRSQVASEGRFWTDVPVAGAIEIRSILESLAYELANA